MMSNKSPQEPKPSNSGELEGSVKIALNEILRHHDDSCTEGVRIEEVNSIVALFTSHMQAGFEYVVEPNGRVGTDDLPDPYNISLEVQRRVKETQAKRIAEWLLGSKENQ